MKKQPALVLPLVGLALVLAGCGSGSTSDDGDSSGPAKPNADGLIDPGERTIGVLASNASSETLGRWIAQIKATNARLGWTTSVCNGNGNPVTMDQCAQSFVTRQADAIVTLSLTGSEITKGAAQAEQAGIPVIAAGIDPGPEYLEMFDAVYASSANEVGKFVGTWIGENLPDAEVVGSDVSTVYGGHGFVMGVQESLKEAGKDYSDLRDTDLTTLVASMTQNAQATFQANPGDLTFVDCCDFGGSIIWPVVERAGRTDDVQLVTRFDNPSTVKLAKSGANIHIVVERGSEHIFDLADGLLEYWLNDTELESKVNSPEIDLYTGKDFGDRDLIYPFAADLDAQVEEWSDTYQLEDSEVTAP